MPSRGLGEITGGLFDKQWANTVYFLYGLWTCVLQFEGLAEKPCLCEWVSVARGMLIIWIFILFPDIHDCPAVFVRKQTGNMAPEERSGSIYFKLPLVSRKKKEMWAKIEKA